MLDRSSFALSPAASGKGELAERALRSAIVNCVMEPGERLSEVALVEEFALGRGAVRAALARLKSAGLVSSSARSGWAVMPISASEIRELSAARRHLEPLLSSVLLDEVALQRLVMLADTHLALTQRGDMNDDILPTIRRCEREILELLAERLGMPIVAGWLVDLWDRSVRLVNFFEKTGRVRLVPAGRSQLVHAIIDGRKAEALEHLAAANTSLETYLFDRFLESEAVVGGRGNRRTVAKDKPGRVKRPKDSIDRTRI
ncbi:MULTISPECIES: GntR family transcriptional regulator [Agrobacterium]|nr:MULTISPECIES: GntR family transcriptional regulator [Agrobacterium]CUX70157.1 Transcriptional regulator [Agrobacterium sp. NCPPB 925]